jgi:heme/copper-type cytochrome/quinol oxidase subunit 2
MIAMRSLSSAVFILFALAAAPLFAQEHHHHHVLTFETPVPIQVEPTGVTRTFNVIARQFDYVVSPLPFEANVGDSVVLNITSEDVLHGFIMDRYHLTPEDIRPNKTTKVTFTADKSGQFLYACTNFCGEGHSAMNGNFVVKDAVQPPTVTSFSPTTGTTAGGTAVTITGTSFVAGATVLFGATQAQSVNVQSATTIIATSPAHSAGGVPITVTNPDSSSATKDGFLYVTPSPTITSVSPSTGPNNGGTAITIAGTNFVGGATVTIGGKPATSVNVVSPTTITAVTPVAAIGATTVDVVVTNPDASTTTSTGGFHYTAAPLAITSISPNIGVPAGGTSVTITGTGFGSAAGASVTFGGVAGTSLTVVDPVTLTVKTPAHAVGAVNVVINMNGTATLTNGFTYAEPPPRRRAVKR